MERSACVLVAAVCATVATLGHLAISVHQLPAQALRLALMKRQTINIAVIMQVIAIVETQQHAHVVMQEDVFVGQLNSVCAGLELVIVLEQPTAHHRQ